MSETLNGSLTNFRREETVSKKDILKQIPTYEDIFNLAMERDLSINEVLVLFTLRTDMEKTGKAKSGLSISEIAKGSKNEIPRLFQMLKERADHDT
jgi:hypothetical protein